MNIKRLSPINIVLHKNDKRLENIVFMDDVRPNEHSQIGMVFGCNSLNPKRVDKVIELYKNDKIEKILVSGGISRSHPERTIPEAIEMQDYLIKEGIPKRDIFTEDKSTNTSENVLFSLDLLHDENYSDNTQINLVSSEFHLRRCFYMFANHYAIENLLASGAKDGKYDKDIWYNTDYGKRMIYMEALKLCYYSKKGIMKDFETEGFSRRLKK